MEDAHAASLLIKGHPLGTSARGGGWMIHARNLEFQLVLWETEARSEHPALKLEFDTHEDAIAAFEAHKLEGRYRTGTLLRRHRWTNDWSLVDRFPK